VFVEHLDAEGVVELLAEPWRGVVEDVAQDGQGVQ